MVGCIFITFLVWLEFYQHTVISSLWQVYNKNPHSHCGIARHSTAIVKVIISG